MAIIKNQHTRQANVVAGSASQTSATTLRATSLQLPRRADAPGSAAEIKDEYRRFYDALNAQLDASAAGRFSLFLNYGYESETQSPELTGKLKRTLFSQRSATLVHKVLAECPLDDKEILDIGCGRGGTIHLIKQSSTPRSITGVDLSSEAIRFCREFHGNEHTSFTTADAEELPFRDRSFDVVVNIESSHSYPNRERFCAQVARVLRTNGWFLHADVLSTNEFQRLAGWLSEHGMIRMRDIDVTANVLKSCEAEALQRAAVLKDAAERRSIETFVGSPGTDIYQGLCAGILRYRICSWRMARRD
jgi:ubiquinone/menaquinone biosynthesis C-methylase UbiE